MTGHESCAEVLLVLRRGPERRVQRAVQEEGEQEKQDEVARATRLVDGDADRDAGAETRKAKHGGS